MDGFDYRVIWVCPHHFRARVFDLQDEDLNSPSCDAPNCRPFPADFRAQIEQAINDLPNTCGESVAFLTLAEACFRVVERTPDPYEAPKMYPSDASTRASLLRQGHDAERVLKVQEDEFERVKRELCPE